MIPVCHNVRRYFNKVFSGLAKNGKGTMGWCQGFKLHLLCNDSGEGITFCLTGANVDDRDSRVWNVFNVSSTNSEQSKLCINSPLQIDARLLWEQAIGSNGT